MVKREIYLSRIEPFIDRPLVKVLTGIRRSGKSELLKLIKARLIERGVQVSDIIYINFESMIHADITSARQLYDYVREQVRGTNKCYVFLDEIQQVSEWERAINAFTVDFAADVYITGSNSRLLSSELATLIAGRYVEFPVAPLSFAESLDFKHALFPVDIMSVRQEFERYFRIGGFPVLHANRFSEADAFKVVSDIYASALLRDVIERRNIRNTQLLGKVARFVFDNIGSTFSAKKVADYFKSQQRRVDTETVYNYLDALEQAFIIQKAPRYDLKGKEALQTNEKYFIGDHALRNAALGYSGQAVSGLLENIIYLELKRRGYQVYVGKLNDKEIDFVAVRREEKIYIQAAYKLNSEETVKREFEPLLAVNDHYPKYVVTMDEFWRGNIEGVKHVHVAEFLLDDSY